MFNKFKGEILMRKGFWLILLLNICVLLAGCGIAEDKIVNISDRHSKPPVSLTFLEIKWNRAMSKRSKLF